MWTSFLARREPTALLKASSLALLFAAVFFLPYLITPPLAISRSYVAGYSNRAAVVLLVLGTSLYGWFTRGQISRTQDKDSSLPWSALALGLLASLLACRYGSRWPPYQIPGGEAFYFLNRQQMLAAGRIPYRDFEFCYGPLLLYPSLWAQHLLHDTALRGYTLTWTFECLLGTAMIWAVVCLIDIRVPSRWLLFTFLLLSQLIWLDLGGLSYTPFRQFCAAFWIAVSYAVWRRTHNPWWMASCSVIAVALSIACSLDQAIGVAFGLNAYMLLLHVLRRSTFPLSALVLAGAGSLGCFFVAARCHMLLTLEAFGSGGYSYPVLPSPSIILALFAYVIAGGVLYKTVSSNNLDSATLPLTLGGMAMLPAAMGRCDLLHVAAATPLFVVGVAAICAMPRVRRWWLPLAALGLIVLPPALVRKNDILDEMARLIPSTSDWVDNMEDVLSPSQNQWYLSASELPASALPCDHTYFSPSYMPLPLEGFRLSCLDTGYYLGYTNVITPASIQSKIDELRSRPAMPLLMENTPLADQIPLQLATMSSLHVESASFWVPPERHAPLTYAALIDYIQTHYDPGPVLLEGRIRIWMPRPVK